METLKAQNILPNINAEDFTRSHTQIYKQTIDNPHDNDLKRRQTLWSFQQKNRGVRGKFKETERVAPFDYDDCNESSSTTEDTKEKSSRRLVFPKLKQKVKTEVHVPPLSDESGTVKREYSSALRIGNSLYEQLRIKQNLDVKPRFPKQRSLLKSFDRFPDVSSSLTKLGYLKATKNVVHYGGGFFGRNGPADRRYVDFRRSWTMLTPAESNNVHNESKVEKKQYYGSMKQLSTEETTRLKNLYSTHTDTEQTEVLKISSSDICEKNAEEKRLFEHHRQKRKIEKESDSISKRSKEEMIELEMLSEKYSINFDKTDVEEIRSKDKDENGFSEEHIRRNEEWQKQIDMMVAKRDRDSAKRPNFQNDKRHNSTKNQKNKKTQTMQTEKFENTDERPESDVSLDIPEDQFGPSSYKPDEVNNRLLNAAYCINPYKWTSRSSLTDGDRGWVEKAMEKTEIIDTTNYDVFARKKQKSTVKNGEHSGKDKTVASSKPP